MKIKSLLLTMICFLILSISAFAEETIVYKENFAGYKVEQTPVDFIIKSNGDKVLIKSLKANEPSANVLELDDNSVNSGITVMKKIKEISGSEIAVETKFRIERNLGGFEFSAGNNSGNAFSLVTGEDGITKVTNGNSYKAFENKIKILNWNTVRAVINMNTGKLDIRLNSETLYNLTVSGGFDLKDINYFIIKTTSGSPKARVDFIKVNKGTKLDASTQSIEAPVVSDPVPRPLKDRINVLYNNEYKYFDYPLIMRNDRVMIPLRRGMEMLQMTVNWNNENKTAICETDDLKIEVTNNSNIVKLNGVSKTIDTVVFMKENSLYIPLRFFAESTNKNVSWDDLSKTVIIND